MDAFDPDAYLAQAAAAQPVVNPEQLQNVQQSGDPGQFNPDEFIQQAQEEKYGTTEQMIKTGLEGIAEGAIGPFAPAIEKAFGVKEEDIRARHETNPLIKGGGQALGLTAGLLTGTGEAAVMTKAGQLASEAAGLGKLAEGASYAARVGSEAVKQAAEMAVLQGSDEVSKMILNDPAMSSESALSNIGLAAALGGAGGAFMTGAMSPLWNATAGPAVEKGLGKISSYLNGPRVIVPEETVAAMQALGVDAPPLMKGVLAGDENAIKQFNTLRYAQNHEATAAIDKFKTDVSDKVMDSLGIPLENARVYSKNEAGKALEDTFKKEYSKLYAPQEAAMELRNAQAAKIAIDDAARLSEYGKILEQGMTKVGTDSPAYKLYNDWGNRLLAKDTIGGIDQLKTELSRDVEKAVRAADYNTSEALKDIRNRLGDFQENQILKQATSLEKEGMEGAGKLGRDLMAERQAANASYKDFAKMSNELLDHVGAGRFHGAGSLLKKIESVGAEGLLNKFSPKNNADIIPFLAKNFPETLEHVRQNELLEIIKPAIAAAKDGEAIGVDKLTKLIEKGFQGKKELMDFAIPKEAMTKIQSADHLLELIPKIKDSGTPGGLAKLLNKIPQSAMSAIAMLGGHNPITGYVAGELAHMLGRDAPDAVRLAFLKFLGSEQPIKASGFKSMVEFIHNTYKGENMLAKGAVGIFKSGAQVIPVHAMPDSKDRVKLDKQVEKFQKNPQEIMMRLSEGEAGHYMPNHQAELAKTTTAALQYLESIKPKPFKPGPLDKEIPPTPAAEARYNRALDIANQPLIVMEHIKNGTLQATDVGDLKSLYPALYTNMANKISNQMANAGADEGHIPYQTRIGLSLFFGQGMDSTMTPQSIQAAQFKPNQQQPQQQGQPQKKPSAKSMNSMEKMNNMFKTPIQASESDRSSRK